MPLSQGATAALTILLSASVQRPAPPGLITRPSAHSAAETADRFAAAAKNRGFLIFARLDHAAAAKSVGLEMPPATVIVFGNPRVGTPVFLQTPTIAIDLPMKAMVWSDSTGKVFLSYNSAKYLFGTIYPRHGAQPDPAVEARVESALAAIADEAVK
jgi:uncharacterized protein (DUF302 family)